jgi:hypothetical protein
MLTWLVMWHRLINFASSVFCLLRCSSTSGELGCGRRLVVAVVTNRFAVEALLEFTDGAKWWLDGRSVDGVESGLL